MDLKVINDAKGGYVYRDHLPLLGQHSSEIKPGHGSYQVGDQVCKTQTFTLYTYELRLSTKMSVLVL